MVSSSIWFPDMITCDTTKKLYGTEHSGTVELLQEKSMLYSEVGKAHDPIQTNYEANM